MTDEVSESTTAPAAETPSGADVQDDDALQVEATEGDEDGGEQQSEPEVELEDIEDGEVKFKVPKGYRDRFLMHADYTRKTQEVAEARRQFDSERESFTKSQEAQKAYVADLGRVAVLDEALAGYAKVDWMTLKATNPESFDQHWIAYQQLKDQREGAAKKVAEHEGKAKAESEGASSKAYNENVGELVRDIPGWGPDLAGKAIAVAKSVGLSDKDIETLVRQPNGAKLIKLAHQAAIGQEVAKKAKASAEKAKAAVKPAEEKPEPIEQVTKKRGGPAPVVGLSDDLSPEEWVKRRDAQERKLRA